MGLKKVTVLLFFLALSIISSKGQWTARSLPNPKNDFHGCGLTGTVSKENSWICNPDNILSPQTVQNINSRIVEMNRNLSQTNCRGFQFAVAIVDQISSDYPRGKEGVKQMAKELHNSWGVGDASCQNGVLLLLSTTERAYFVSTGKGAKNFLPRETIKAVGDRSTSLLKNKNYDAAIEQMVEEYCEILEGKAVRSQGGVFGFILCGLIFGLCLFCASQNARKYKLKRLRKQMEEKRIFTVNVCPICLEDLKLQTPPTSSEGKTEENFKEGEKVRERKLREDKEREYEELVKSLPADTHLLLCGHLFHQKCITKWERTKRECPVCRTSMDGNESLPTEIRPINLETLEGLGDLDMSGYYSGGDFGGGGCSDGGGSGGDW